MCVASHFLYIIMRIFTMYVCKLMIEVIACCVQEQAAASLRKEEALRLLQLQRELSNLEADSEIDVASLLSAMSH